MRGLAREKSGLVTDGGVHGDRQPRPGVEEVDVDVALERRVPADRVEIVDQDAATGNPREVLRCLDRRTEDRPAPQEIDHYLPALLGGDEVEGTGRLDSPIGEPVRKHEHVRREPIAAEVGALPDLARAMGGELGRDRPAAKGAARIVAPVGADEVERRRRPVGRLTVRRHVERDVEQLAVGGVASPRSCAPHRASSR